MSDDSTGSGSTGIVARSNGPSIVEGVSVSGDAYTATLATSGTRSTGAAESPVPRGRPPSPQVPKVLPKVKHKCYALFSTCIDNLDRAIDSDENVFLRYNAIEQVKDTLSELWKVRLQREEQFGELINVLQGAFAQRTVEDFTAEQLDCLRVGFRRLREEPVYDDSFANAVTLELLSGGIDAFRAIE